MSEPVLIALIMTCGSMWVAWIQTRSKQREQAASHEDREIAEEAVEALKEEIRLLRLSPSSPCSYPECRTSTEIHLSADGGGSASPGNEMQRESALLSY